MRRFLSVVILAACAAAPRPVVVAPVAAVAAPAPPAPATAAQITKLSHDLLDAYDRGEVAPLEAAAAPTFLHLEGGHASKLADEVKELRARRPGQPFIARRTWDQEQVHLHADSAIYIGRATEQQGGNDSKGGYKHVGLYLLEWVRLGDAWKLHLWTWQRAGDVSRRDSWNEIFRNGLGFERKPNRLLVETVKGRKPGTALDLGMGQGRNALHLAEQGWKVTGVDIADEGIRLAREEAAKRKLSIEMINTNVDEYDLGTNRWDLVTMIYEGTDEKWIAKVKPSLRKGGLFVLEYFARDEGRNRDVAPPGTLAKWFADGFEILRDEEVEDVPDWAMDRARLVRFVAKKK